MEPYRGSEFASEFYQALSSLCNKNGVMLVFDETITGYRFFDPLAQDKIKCKPDLTVIGKAWANGYPLAGVVGDIDIMQRIENESILNNIFDFSTTHAGETLGLAAAIKVLDIYKEKAVIEQLNQKGKYILDIVKKTIEINAMQDIFQVCGQPTYFKISCNLKNYAEIIMSDLFKFFFENGILFKGIFSVCLSHNVRHLNMLAKSFEEYCKNFDLQKLIQNRLICSS
jgi:glutamate-1-semialdehyde aminotransferase